MIKIEQSGDLKLTTRFLEKASTNHKLLNTLNSYGQKGVQALSAATPVRTGKTASSWGYEISASKGSYTIIWTNSNISNGVNIAVIIQYGHGTRNGGYVKGVDYINPAMKPVFDEIANQVWKEVEAY